MNRTLKRIKNHPWMFVWVFVMVMVSGLPDMIREQSFSYWNILLLIIPFIIYYFLFVMIVDEEDLTNDLNSEVKRLNLSLDELHRISGFNRFEINYAVNNEYAFWISESQKKSLLKKLKKM